MKKSELRHLIKEQIKLVLNEENEEIKAQEQCKVSIFKIKSAFEPILASWRRQDYIEGFTLKVQPYNRGYELKMDFKYSWRRFADNKEDEATKKIGTFISNNSSVWIQPGSFFQDYFDEKTSGQKSTSDARIEGVLFQLPGEKYQSVRYDVNTKSEIVSKIKEFTDNNLKKLKEVAKWAEE